jgi:hypothetical protein
MVLSWASPKWKNGIDSPAGSFESQRSPNPSAGAIRRRAGIGARRATSRATTAPSELPTRTAGMCFFASQKATRDIALKSSF